MTQVILGLLAIAVIIIFILWLISFKESFMAKRGQISAINIAKDIWFEVRLGDKNAKWYQRLWIYILFWPLSRAKFNYKWVQEMTYSDYLKRLAKSAKKDNYNVSIKWEPQYDRGGTKPDGTIRNSEIGVDGMPLDKSVKILVEREEIMTSLYGTEPYVIAAPFETLDGYHGRRFFKLYLDIESLTNFISETREGQVPAEDLFCSYYNAWSKTVTYKQLRETTMSNLLLVMGNEQNELFIHELSSDVKEFGYRVSKIASGEIYLDLDSKDLLELQEGPGKAQYILDAAVINAQTTETNANAQAKAVTIAATAEATRIKALGIATNTILAMRIGIIKNLYTYQKELIIAKYGKDGLKELKTYIEGGGQTDSAEVQRMVETLIALDIHHNQNTGGTS